MAPVFNSAAGKRFVTQPDWEWNRFVEDGRSGDDVDVALSAAAADLGTDLYVHLACGIADDPGAFDPGSAAFPKTSRLFVWSPEIQAIQLVRTSGSSQVAPAASTATSITELLAALDSAEDRDWLWVSMSLCVRLHPTADGPPSSHNELWTKGLRHFSQWVNPWNFSRNDTIISLLVRTYAYLRVSGRGQIDGDGFPRQREAIANYARRHGLTIAEEFRDEGISGTRELASRPGLAALLDRLEHTGVKLVVVERSDRLARDLLVGEVILGQFRKLKVNVVDSSGTSLNADDADPTRVLIRQVLGAVAQFEKAVTVLKLRAARDRIRTRTGRCEGRRPFGHYPHEQLALSVIGTLRRKPRGGRALSFAEIARRLNEQGLPTRTGVPWSPGSVFAIVKRGARTKRRPTTQAAGKEERRPK